MTDTSSGTTAVTSDTLTVKLGAAFCLVVLLSVLCFLPDLHNGLLDWDDSGYILDNVHIRSLTIETVRWAFFDFYCNYWAPLTWLSFALDYAFWGLNPVGYHLTNNVIHALSAGMFLVLSFWLLRRYLAERCQKGTTSAILNDTHALYCSLLAALIFALHPLRVESVAWAAERKDVLSLFFGLAALLAYLRHTQAMEEQAGSPGRSTTAFVSSPHYWLAVALYSLSLFSKAMLITLPLVLLVLDWFPLKRLGRRGVPSLLLEKAPFILLAGLASMVTMRAMAVTSRSFEEINLISRLLVAFKSTIAYLQLTAWPVDLNPVYVHPGNIASPSLEYLLPIPLFIGITVYCAINVRRRPVFMAVWLVYLITLFPVLGLTQNGPQVMACRFTYAPGLAVSLLVALGITAVLARFANSRAAISSGILGVVFLLAASWHATAQEISVWKDDVTLWTRVIDLKPHVFGTPYFQRAHAYAARAEYQKAMVDIDEALAIAAGKNYGRMHEIYAARARILRGAKDLDGAIADFSRAIEASDFPLRSFYYRERGGIYQEQGKAGLASEDFRMGLMPQGAE